LPIGYIIYEFASAPKTGEPNKLDKIFGISFSLKWKVYKNWILHIHHWLYLIIFMLMTYYVQYKQNHNNKIMLEAFKGFCIGGSV